MASAPEWTVSTAGIEDYRPPQNDTETSLRSDLWVQSRAHSKRCNVNLASSSRFKVGSGLKRSITCVFKKQKPIDHDGTKDVVRDQAWLISKVYHQGEKSGEWYMVFLVSLGVCDEWGITVSRATDMLLTAGFWTCYHSKTDWRSDHIRAFSLRVLNTFRVIFFFWLRAACICCCRAYLWVHPWYLSQVYISRTWLWKDLHDPDCKSCHNQATGSLDLLSADSFVKSLNQSLVGKFYCKFTDFTHSRNWIQKVLHLFSLLYLSLLDHRTSAGLPVFWLAPFQSIASVSQALLFLYCLQVELVICGSGTRKTIADAPDLEYVIPLEQALSDSVDRKCKSITNGQQDSSNLISLSFSWSLYSPLNVCIMIHMLTKRQANMLTV
jgi:hypothetical protein